MIHFRPTGIVGRAGALPERKTVGAWHWGQRVDPPESALQVWRLSCVSLRSYILVNSMSVIINVRMTERLMNETAGLEQCAGASPVSIAITVLEI